MHRLAPLIRAGLLGFVLVIWSPGCGGSERHATGTTIAMRSQSRVQIVKPGESIQAALNAARPGDTVQLAVGTYRENLLVSKRSITIRGPATLLPPGEGDSLSLRCVCGRPKDERYLHCR
jgi:hypothetical protein